MNLIVDFLSCLWEYAKEEITREIGAVADLSASFARNIAVVHVTDRSLQPVSQLPLSMGVCVTPVMAVLVHLTYLRHCRCDPDLSCGMGREGF